MIRVVRWRVQGIGDASEKMVTDDIFQSCNEEVDCGCCWDVAHIINVFKQDHPDVLIFKVECFGPVDPNLN